ncbi:MAG: hypothetical protein M1831_005325 [Alyxoria varia]|nr:MAG: hypothetical protein M1831_005325 [Alyxoria varia]
MNPEFDHTRSAHPQTRPAILGLQSPDQSIAKPLLYHAVAPANAPQVLPRLSQSHQYVEVRPTSGKGLGLFATHFIPTGTRFLSETPLLALKPGEDAPELYEKFTRLSHPVQSHVRCFTSQQPPRRQAEMRLKLARRGYESDLISTILEIVSIFQANAFKLEEGHMIFPQTARINHSCLPNAHTNFNSSSNQMHTHALQDIKRGVEIEISYWNMTMPRSERQKAAAERGFRCNCCVCDLRDDGETNELEQIRAKMREVIYARNRLSFGAETGGREAYRNIIHSAFNIIKYLEGRRYCDPSLPELYHVLAVTKEELTPLHTRRPEFHREVLGHYDSALQAEVLMTGEDSKSTRQWRELFELTKQHYYTAFPVEATLDTRGVLIQLSQ